MRAKRGTRWRAGAWPCGNCFGEDMPMFLARRGWNQVMGDAVTSLVQFRQFRQYLFIWFPAVKIKVKNDRFVRHEQC